MIDKKIFAAPEAGVIKLYGNPTNSSRQIIWYGEEQSCKTYRYAMYSQGCHDEEMFFDSSEI